MKQPEQYASADWNSRARLIMPSVPTEYKGGEARKERRAAIYTPSEMEKHCADSAAGSPSLLRQDFNAVEQ